MTAPEAEAMATIDRAQSTTRVAADVDELTGSNYTLVPDAIRRYAYTDVYRNTLDYFAAQFEALGFEISYDPVGTFVARNRPVGEPVFGIGSHCDSNRNGGPYDGTLGVVVALEICRLNAEHGTDLPLQVISFLEEEGSAFAQMLLGSRIMVQRVEEADLRERFVSTDDGRTFWEHAKDAGYKPERWRESGHVLDDLTGWDRDAHRAGPGASGHQRPTRDRERHRRIHPRRYHRDRPLGPRRRDAHGLPQRRRGGRCSLCSRARATGARGRRWNGRDGR